MAAGPFFNSCVERLPPESAQRDPSWTSRKLDKLRHQLSQKMTQTVRSKREKLRKILHEEKKKLKIQVDLF